MRGLAVVGLSGAMIHAALAAARPHVERVLIVDDMPEAPDILKLSAADDPARVKHWQRGGRLPFYATAPRHRKRR